MEEAHLRIKLRRAKKDFMREITLEELLEAGCHFGHQVTRQNPKARDFIYEARDNIHIIDLAKTKEELELAGSFVKDLAAKGGTMMILGTKRQAKGVAEEEIKRIAESGADGIYSITNRWVGGTFTNFSEVSKNFKKLHDIVKRLQDDEEKAKYTKKEIGLWEKERTKLTRLYGGIADLQKLPDAIFVIDTHLEALAVDEAGKMGVTIVGIVDTNADPLLVDYPIPANDDAVGSIKLIINYIADAWIEGRKLKENGKTATTEAQNLDEAQRTKLATTETQKAKSVATEIKKRPKKNASKK